MKTNNYILKTISIIMVNVMLSTTFAVNTLNYVHTINIWWKWVKQELKKNNWTVITKWVSSVNNSTIYEPYIKFQLNHSNYSGVKTSWYSWNNSSPNNNTITWENWLKFEKKWGNNWYTTVWYDVWNLFKQSRNIQISYDEIFKNGAGWGGINIGDWIVIDTNPNRIWFRWPEIYWWGVSKDEMHHVDIFINEVWRNSVNVKVYIDNKKIVEHIYTSSNIANVLNKIWLRSNFYKGTVIYNNLVIIPQDEKKIDSSEKPLSTYYINNGKEKYKYTYSGYYKPFWPNRGHWNVKLVWCMWDYSLTPTTDGGEKCEMWCTIGSSKIGYCRIK